MNYLPQKLFLILFLGATSLLSLAQVPRSQHVWLITEENHSYEQASEAMPYLMSMANQYGLATQSYADMHNSLSTLMHLTSGQTVTNNDNTTLYFNVDNIVRRVMGAGLTWRSYQESIPYAGYEGIGAYPYVKRHNPLAFFTDTNTSAQRIHSVPQPANFTTAPEANFNYVTPNLLHDAHDGTMAAADSWLKSHLSAILARPEFQSGGDGLMIITFDEGNLGPTDFRCSATTSSSAGNGCGGHILTVLIGPHVRRGFRSATWHNHESVLKTVCMSLGLSGCPGTAETALPMSEFFANGYVKILAPVTGSLMQAGHAFTFKAQTVDPFHPVNAMKVYVDNIKVYTTFSGFVDTALTLTAGTHNVVVNAWDSSGALFQTRQSITAR